MATWLAYGVLLVAAIFEAGGDALVRLGLHSPTSANRIGFFAAGAVVLFLYGLTVNAPNWDFGRLLGVYVTLFFVVAQVINLIVFHVKPGPPILLGGGLIIAGGLIMTLWRTA